MHFFTQETREMKQNDNKKIHLRISSCDTLKGLSVESFKVVEILPSGN